VLIEFNNFGVKERGKTFALAGFSMFYIFGAGSLSTFLIFLLYKTRNCTHERTTPPLQQAEKFL